MTLRELPFGAPDDGRVDARLADALASVPPSGPTHAVRAEVLAALAGARVFVAVRAEATGEERSAAGQRQESAAEMSLVCLRSDDGVLAVPVFSDGHAVQRWVADARPVPLPGPQACGAARDSGASVLLVDPGAAAFVVTAGELRALAEGYVPVPGSEGLETRRSPAVLGAPAGPVDPALVRALADALRDEPVTEARLLEGPTGLVLGLVGPALEPAALAGLVARLLERTRDALPPGGLDVAQVEQGVVGQGVVGQGVVGQETGVAVSLQRRRRGLLRRGR